MVIHFQYRFLKDEKNYTLNVIKWDKLMVFNSKIIPDDSILTDPKTKWPYSRLVDSKLFQFFEKNEFGIYKNFITQFLAESRIPFRIFDSNENDKDWLVTDCAETYSNCVVFVIKKKFFYMSTTLELKRIEDNVKIWCCRECDTWLDSYWERFRHEINFHGKNRKRKFNESILSQEIYPTQTSYKRIRKAIQKTRVDLSFDFETFQNKDNRQIVCVVGLCISTCCLYKIDKFILNAISTFQNDYLEQKYNYVPYEFEMNGQTQTAYAKGSFEQNENLVKEFAMLVRFFSRSLPDYCKLHMVGFNNGKFDNHLLLKWLKDCHSKKTYFFWIERQGRLMKIFIGNIIISDLMCMNAPMSLNQTCISIFGPDITKLDCDTVTDITSAILMKDRELMKDIMKYCAKDCWLLNQLLFDRDKKFNEIYKQLIPKIPVSYITNTKVSRDDPTPLKITYPKGIDIFQMSASASSITEILADLFIFKENVPLGKVALDMRKCILGGIVRIGMLGEELNSNYYQLDLATMYGNVMSQALFPSGPFHLLTEEIVNRVDELLSNKTTDIRKYPSVYCYVHYEPENDRDIATHCPLVTLVEYETEKIDDVKSRKGKNLCEIFKTVKDESIYMTVVDMITLCQHGWKVWIDRDRINEGYYQNGPWIRPFQTYITHLIEESIRLKRENKPVLRMLTKLLGNGLYGKKCQKPIQSINSIVNVEDLDHFIEKSHQSTSLRRMPDINYSLRMDNDFCFVKEEKETPFNKTPSQHGAIILSWSRNLMASFMRQFDDQRTNRIPLNERNFFNYGDTDSIRVPYSDSVQKTIDNSPQRTIFDENTCEWTNIAFSIEMKEISTVRNLGKKCYFIIDKDGNTAFSCKGQNTKIIDVENFKNVIEKRSQAGETTLRYSCKSSLKTTGGDATLSFVPLKRQLNFTPVTGNPKIFNNKRTLLGPSIDYKKDFFLCGHPQTWKPIPLKSIRVVDK